MSAETVRLALDNLTDALAAIKIECDQLPPIGPMADHTVAIAQLVADAEQQVQAIRDGQP